MRMRVGVGQLNITNMHRQVAIVKAYKNSKIGISHCSLQSTASGVSCSDRGSTITHHAHTEMHLRMAGFHTTTADTFPEHNQPVTTDPLLQSKRSSHRKLSLPGTFTLTATLREKKNSAAVRVTHPIYWETVYVHARVIAKAKHPLLPLSGRCSCGGLKNLLDTYTPSTRFNGNLRRWK